MHYACVSTCTQFMSVFGTRVHTSMRASWLDAFTRTTQNGCMHDRRNAPDK